MGSEKLKNKKVFLWLGDQSGGAEAVILALAKELQSRPNIYVALGVFKNVRIDDDFNTIQAGYKSDKARGYANLLASIVLKLSGKLNNYDIVITHTGGFWNTRKSVFVYHEAVNLKQVLRNMPFLSKIFAATPLFINRISLDRADIVMAATKDALTYIASFRTKPLLKCSSFFDDQIFTSRSLHTLISEKRLTIIFAGRSQDRIKNFNGLKQAVQLLRDDVEMRVTGEGVSNGNITYLGWLSKEDLKKEYERGHVLVLPSFNEGFSLVLLEALATGLPVIASKAAVPTELIDFVYTCGTSSQSIHDAIIEVRTDYTSVAKKTFKQAETIRSTYAKSVVVKKEIDDILGEYKLFST